MEQCKSFSVWRESTEKMVFFGGEEDNETTGQISGEEAQGNYKSFLWARIFLRRTR
jgi:hypothetical protein